jgi:hypothetical protein
LPGRQPRGEAHTKVREVLQQALADPAASSPPWRADRRRARHPLSLGRADHHQRGLEAVRGDPPHNHQTWASSASTPAARTTSSGGAARTIRPASRPRGARCLRAGDLAPLGRDIIHSVVNPLARPTGAIHIYGGDFFTIARSEWDDETLTEQPYDQAKTRALFEN